MAIDTGTTIDTEAIQKILNLLNILKDELTKCHANRKKLNNKCKDVSGFLDANGRYFVNLKNSLKKCEEQVETVTNYLSPPKPQPNPIKIDDEENPTENEVTDKQSTTEHNDIVNGDLDESTVDQSTAESMELDPIPDDLNHENETVSTTITILDEVGDTETPPPPLEHEPVEMPKKKRSDKRRAISRKFYDKSPLNPELWGFEDPTDEYFCFWCGAGHDAEKVLLLHIESEKCNEKDEQESEEIPLNSSFEDCEIKDLPTTGHKCMNCQVTPFETKEELEKHILLKHTIRCKYCGENSESFKSRGYLNAHQKDTHPEIWRKIQERKMKKKAESSAAAT